MTFTAGLYFACPVEKIARWDKGYYVNIPQTPGRLDVPPEPESAGPADGAQDFPPLRSVGTYFESETPDLRGETR